MVRNPSETLLLYIPVWCLKEEQNDCRGDPTDWQIDVKAFKLRLASYSFDRSKVYLHHLHETLLVNAPPNKGPITLATPLHHFSI